MAKNYLLAPFLVLQVIKLNATLGQKGRQVATFLGGSQADAGAEAKAARGDFLLVYVTPEKLATSGFRETFLTELNKNSGGIALVAVDEAHCVR